MAQVGSALSGWLTGGSPSSEVTLFSVVLLLTLIALLTLCTKCARHSFELQHKSKGEEMSSELIRVTALVEAHDAIENPGMKDLKDEKALKTLPVSKTPQYSAEPDNVLLKPWRSHTGELNHTGEQQSQITKEELNPQTKQLDPAQVTVCALVGNQLKEVESTNSSALPETTKTQGHNPFSQSRGDHGSGVRQNLSDSPNLVHHSFQSIDEPRGDHGSGVRQNLSDSPNLVHHSFQSLGEPRGPGPELCLSSDAVAEEPGYQRLEELKSHSPPPSPVLEPDLPDKPTHLVGVEEGLTGMGLNAIYAQVSKKRKSPDQTLLSPPEKEGEKKNGSLFTVQEA